ncbi:MAG: hypothetical protein R3E39_23000 [Anaerolineae bacterium]
MSDQFTPQEQFLVERLRRAPQPELNPSAFEAIRLRVLDAVDTPPIPAPRPALPVTTIVVAASVVVIVAALFVVFTQRNTPTTEIPTPSAAPTATLTLSPTASPTPTITPSPTSIATLVPSATPDGTAAVDTVMIIEGQVEAIDGDIVTIFGVEVQILPDDPLLESIHIGDVIRVEGSTTTSGSGVIVIASSHIEPNNTPTPASSDNPPSGAEWSDDGTCLHPPPDWAPANGWRRRCEGAEKNVDKSNNGSGKGNNK